MIKITEDTITELFNKLKELKENDDKINRSFQTFAKLISDNQNDVFISETQLEGFIKALDIVYPQLGNEFSWYIYDKGDSDWSEYGKIEVGENKYDIHTDEDYLNYLIKEYV